LAPTVALARHEFGGSTCWSTTRGCSAPPAAGATEDDLRSSFEVNQLGPFLGMKAVIEPMTASGAARSSTSPPRRHVRMAGLSTYSSTKFAVRGLTRCAAMELGGLGIRVNSIHRAASTPRWSTAGPDAGAAYAQLAGPAHGPPRRGRSDGAVPRLDESSYCTGSEFIIDGGMGGASASPHRDMTTTAPAPAALLRATGLVAGYGDLAVVHGVDIQVAPGEIVALLGPNGAGSRRRCSPSPATCRRWAADRVAGATARPGLHRRAQEGLGFVSEERSVFMAMSVRDNLLLGSAASSRPSRCSPSWERCWAAGPAAVGRRQQMLTLARALARSEGATGRRAVARARPMVVDRLLAAIQDAVRTRGIGVLLVEQQARRALQVADRWYLMRRALSSRAAPPPTVSRASRRLSRRRRPGHATPTDPRTEDAQMDVIRSS